MRTAYGTRTSAKDSAIATTPKSESIIRRNLATGTTARSVALRQTMFWRIEVGSTNPARFRRVERFQRDDEPRHLTSFT